MIPAEYFKEDAETVSQWLLGCTIRYNGCLGMIVETEAYKNDPASHGYQITPRSEIMLTSYGRVYVYVIYGIYHCLNITTNEGDVGAVLIRALEPLEGIEAMRERRYLKGLKDLTSGPGKLCQAMGITKELNNTVVNEYLEVEKAVTYKAEEIGHSTRVGVTKGKEYEWRYYVTGNQYVSV